MAYRGNSRSIKRIYDRTRRAAYTKLKTLYPELTSEDKFYRFIRLYKGIYQGFSASAEDIYTGRRFTLGLGYEDYDLKTINVAKMACERMIKLSFSEKTHVIIENGEEKITGDVDTTIETPETLQEWFDARFADIDFIGSLIDYGERSFYGIGGLAAQPEIIDGHFEYIFTDGDLYIPLSWRKKKITEEVTVEILKVKQVYYMLVAEHTISEAGTKTEYKLFEGDKQGTNFNKEIKNIEKIIPGQALEIETADGVSKTFVVYERNAKGNNKDFDTPLGIALFGNATDVIASIAQAVDVFYSEFKNGRKRIVVPTELLKERIDPTSGELIKWFDAKSDVYQAFNSANSDAKITDMTTELRVTDILAAIQGLLNLFAIQIGESAGSFTFDAAAGAITATEVVSKNSDTFKTKKLHEKKWTSFIVRLIKQTIRLCELMPEQLTETTMPTVNHDKLKIKVEFDDSVITDDKANRNEARVEVSQGLKSKFLYLIEDRNLSEEEAIEEMLRIATEEQAEIDSLTPDDDSNIDEKSNFEQCILEQMSQGKTEDEAQQMCRKQKKEPE